MLGLRWRRVDLLRRRVDIAETLVSIGGHITFGPPKTKAAVRTVPLPSFMAGNTSVSVWFDRYGHLYAQQDDELMRRLASRAGVPHVGLGGSTWRPSIVAEPDRR